MDKMLSRELKIIQKTLRACKAETVNPQLRKGLVSNYITNKYQECSKDTGESLYLITINFGAENVFSRLWSQVDGIRDALCNEILDNLDSVYYLTSCIEHHHEDKLDKKQEPKKVGRPKKIKENKEEKTVSPDDAYAIYGSKNLSEYEINVSKLENDIAPGDVDDEKKKYVLFNFFHVLYYRHGKTKIDSDFLSYIQDRVDYYSNIIINNIDYKFSSVEEKIIAYHYKTNYTVIGFPHIHITLSAEPIFEPEDNIVQKIRNIISDMDISGDYSVKPPSKWNEELDKKKDPESVIAKAVKYIVKNSQNYFVDSMLNKLLSEHVPIVKTIICDVISDNPEISQKRSITTKRYVEFFQGLMNKNDKKSYQPISMTLMLKTIKSVQEQDVLDMSKDNLHRTCGMIYEHMRKNNLAISDGYIYQKIPGSKSSYRIYYDYVGKKEFSIEHYYDTVTSVDPYSSYAQRYAKAIIAYMNTSHAHDFVHSDFAGKRITFKTIIIDYRMLEFYDFYFSIYTRKIYKKQDRYCCYFYSELKLKDIVDNMDSIMDSSPWLGILKNSNLNCDDVLACFFSTLLPFELKAPILLLYGMSNSGKSTLYKPFTLCFPPNKVSTLDGVINDFIVEYRIKRKEFIIVDECNTLLDNNTDIMLKLLEGKDVQSNKKHGDISSAKVEGSLVASMNIRGNEKFIHNKAIMNRLNPIGSFKSLDNDGSKDREIIRDAGYTILYCGLKFNSFFQEGFFPIVDVLDDNEYRIIESIKNYSLYEQHGLKPPIDYTEGDDINRMPYINKLNKLLRDFSESNGKKYLKNYFHDIL